MKYRKKPIVVDAHQWFKNGDHPEDDRYMVCPDKDSESKFEPFLSEGKIVRHFRRPDIDGDHPCEQCGNDMHNHGWIDTFGEGHNVCPGDWIIKGFQGEFYQIKQDIFEATYEKVEELEAK